VKKIKKGGKRGGGRREMIVWGKGGNMVVIKRIEKREREGMLEGNSKV